MGKVLSRHRAKSAIKAVDTTENEKISFTAEGENCVADRVILYEPGLEVFLSCLHPKASLYEKTTTRKEAKGASNNFVKKLNEHSIKVHNVRDVLKENKEKLLDLANKSLKYNIINGDEKEEKEWIQFNNQYKMKILQDLIDLNDLDSLIDIIICQPEIGISSCPTNTGINLEYIKCKPVGNMVFCRDQQITTNKGVIIGHLNSEQREFETEIMKLVFDNLNIDIIAKVPSDCYLEGGDFIPINSNLCLLGVGLRTNMKAAQYLMDNDLLGTDRFAVVVDKYDQSQDRMHLDTVFNIINDDTVVMLDFDSVPQENNKYRNINRTVNIYQKNRMINNNEYRLIEQDLDFDTFLRNEGFKNVIKVSHEQQLKYIINFLNIGNGNIIAVNKDLKKVIADHKIKNVNVEYVEFSGIKAMYGAAHCATQVSRVPSPPSPPSPSTPPPLKSSRRKPSIRSSVRSRRRI